MEQAAALKKIVLPRPHLLIRLVRANTTFFVANRGGFKTTRGISLYVLDCVYEMPGSTGIILGPSFEHLGDNTLNPLFHALNEFGMEQGVHYVVGERPPEDWPKPLIRVEAKKYDHIISFHNGTNQVMISMAKKASANGISAQWGVFDEIKLIDEKELSAVTMPIFRGNEKALLPNGENMETSSMFMSKFYATDKLADPAHIKWILNQRSKNDPQKIDVIISLQLNLNSLLSEYDAAGVNAKQRLKPQIHAVEVRLAKLRQNLTFYIEANHEDTVQILGKKWLADKKSSMKPYEFKVAIQNADPDKPEEGFYPDFEATPHTHDQADYDPTLPLIIACDYQHSVSPILVAQLSKLPGQLRPSLNYIKEIYTLAPDGLEAAVQLLCDYFLNHRRRIVYYIYDQTAVGKRIDAVEYYKSVITNLRRNRWQVVPSYTGAAPEHYAKYTDTKNWLLNEGRRGRDIRVSGARCPKLIKSITSAPAKMVGGKTVKDKSSEQNSNLDQSETTHFSDVFDMINHAIYNQGLATAGSGRNSGGTAFR